MSAELMRRLRACQFRSELINHRFFREVVHDQKVGRLGVAIVLGQWWHPLHYYPNFLARSIGAFEDLSYKSFLADILNEELGEGDPAMAHEKIFLETMSSVGFSIDEITQAEPSPETTLLIDSYRQGSAVRLKSLGCAFATEVADLAMVGGIGKLVRRVTGAQTLPWVDIHVNQEPNHVSKVTQTLSADFSPEELDTIVIAADEHWLAWCAFFDSVRRRVVDCQVMVTV